MDADWTALGRGLGIADRALVVTGATHGIGKTVAHGLARMGARVVAVGRDEAQLGWWRDMSRSEGYRVMPIRADLNDEEQVEAMASRAERELGSLHGVFANAGGTTAQPLQTMTGHDFRSILDQNLTTAFLTARAFAEKLEPGGAVVFTSSTLARSAAIDFAAYCVSKAGVSMLTKSLALEWARRGIRVNAIAPAGTATEQLLSLLESGDDQVQAVVDAVVARIPMGRLVEPEELILPVAFLLSPHATMITGQVLQVDGGWSIA